MFRRKTDRYEYYVVSPGFYADPTPPHGRPSGPSYTVFGNLGAQGWRYVETINGYYIFEKKVRW